MFSPLEHEEDGAQNLVANGDDSAFVAASTRAWNFDLDGLRSVGGMGELTQEATQVLIAFSHVTGFVPATASLLPRPPKRDNRRCPRHPYRPQFQPAAGPHRSGQSPESSATGPRLDALWPALEQMRAEAQDSGFALLNVGQQFLQDKHVCR